jgi:hypothetical protein
MNPTSITARKTGTRRRRFFKFVFMVCLSYQEASREEQESAWKQKPLRSSAPVVF